MTFDNDTFAWSAARALTVFGDNDVITHSAIIDNGMTGMNAHADHAFDFEQKGFFVRFVMGRMEYSTESYWADLTIVEYAKETKIDLILLGTHGRGTLAHLLVGSVAERVVRMAPCPVFTLKDA